MCLQEVYTDEDMNRIVEGLPEVAEGVVEVWKAVGGKPKYFAPLYGYNFLWSFDNGLNIAQKTLIKKPYAKYWSGFHFFQNKLSAMSFRPSRQNLQFLKCYTLKSWITSVGTTTTFPYLAGLDKNTNLTKNTISFVASQAFFPTYPETEARLEDFLEYLKTKEAELQPAEKI